MGGHFIKSWSATQGAISLSSGEAEFYGVVKAAGIALGYQALLADLGVELPVRVWTDSSATMGICGRQGLGKLRHVDTKSLWVQQKVRDGSLEFRKVRGEVNPADHFTKHLSSEARVTELLRLFGCHFVGGRAEGAPQLRRETGVSHSGVLAMESEHLAEKVCQDGWAYPAMILEEFGRQKVPEAHLHDERVLPHQILGNLEATFPRAIAGEEELEEPVRPDALEERGRALGQLPRASGLRGQAAAATTAEAATSATSGCEVPGGRRSSQRAAVAATGAATSGCRGRRGQNYADGIGPGRQL